LWTAYEDSGSGGKPQSYLDRVDQRDSRCRTHTVHRSATPGCQRRIKSTDTPQIKRSRLPPPSLPLCQHSFPRWKTHHVPPRAATRAIAFTTHAQHCCNEAFPEQGNPRAGLLLHRAGCTSIRRGFMFHRAPNVCDGHDDEQYKHGLLSTLIQTTTAPNNQIEGFSDGQLGCPISVRGCGVFP
jgi:hypothetical protein